MPDLNLASAEGLRSLATQYEAALADPNQHYRGWTKNLAELLAWVASTPASERAELEFQRRLWESSAVANAGQGNFNIDKALEDAAFRAWFAEETAKPLPEDPAALVERLQALYRETSERIRKSVGRTPHLRILRTLAALYPFAFTTIADLSRINDVHRQMFGGPRRNEVDAHTRILGRLEEVLGPAGKEFPDWTRRMTLPWFIAERLQAAAGAEAPSPPANVLVPLPANKRRKGMTAIRGGLDNAVALVEFMGDGRSREDVLAFLKQENPALKSESSVVTTLSVFRGELGLLENDGDRIVLSELGRQFRESGDGDVIVPHLLTRILGVDHLLVFVRDNGPSRHRDVLQHLRVANPGWTSNFAPQAIITWLKSTGLIEYADNRIALTERGRRWAARILWTPENLPPREGTAVVSDVVDTAVLQEATDEGAYVPPALSTLLERLPRQLVFPREQLAALHAGLWSHPSRHFAIFTGLSGAGKTSLARAYAHALMEAGAHESRHVTMAVQPGWSDPSSVLGYIDPLRPERFVRTRLTDLLISCVENPEEVHVAILDEMNLSHPEQYLAPLLSAMETGDAVTFHTQGDEPIDDVPAQIRYPPNLVLIGTVNMDETTHGLSDKVLDRAITLEFWDISIADYPRWGSRKLSPEVEGAIRAALGDLLEVLSPVRLHFGWRVIDEVLSFVERALEGGELEPTGALDWVVYSKVVPKLRGHDSSAYRKAFAEAHQVLTRHRLSRSARKVAELERDLKETGSARFWR